MNIFPYSLLQPSSRRIKSQISSNFGFLDFEELQPEVIVVPWLSNKRQLKDYCPDLIIENNIHRTSLSGCQIELVRVLWNRGTFYHLLNAKTLRQTYIDWWRWFLTHVWENYHKPYYGLLVQNVEHNILWNVSQTTLRTCLSNNFQSSCYYYWYSYTYCR